MICLTGGCDLSDPHENVWPLHDACHDPGPPLAEVDVSACATEAGPRGVGEALVMVHANGNVEVVSLNPPFDHTPIGACIAERVSGLDVPPLHGRSWVAAIAFSTN